jgi:hypothetical protein
MQKSGVRVKVMRTPPVSSRPLTVDFKFIDGGDEPHRVPQDRSL